jgi:hypothetical protein
MSTGVGTLVPAPARYFMVPAHYGVSRSTLPTGVWFGRGTVITARSASFGDAAGEEN